MESCQHDYRRMMVCAKCGKVITSEEWRIYTTTSASPRKVDNLPTRFLRYLFKDLQRNYFYIHELRTWYLMDRGNRGNNDPVNFLDQNVRMVVINPLKNMLLLRSAPGRVYVVDYPMVMEEVSEEDKKRVAAIPFDSLDPLWLTLWARLHEGKGVVFYEGNGNIYDKLGHEGADPAEDSEGDLCDSPNGVKARSV